MTDSRTPPPLPPSAPAVKKPAVAVWVVLAVAGGLALVAIVGIVAAILIPTVSKVRETALRVTDHHNARQVAQAAMLWAMEHDSQLPPPNLTASGDPRDDTPATIHAVAAALAHGGGLNDASVWFSASERGDRRVSLPAGTESPVWDESQAILAPDFARSTVIAWDFATGLNLSLPPTTPVAWTRGLTTEGTWDADTAVYGKDGGIIVFLGGNVQFFPDLRAAPLTRPDGMRTSNILETLPSSARIVGAGPGTLHGQHGLAPSR